MPQQRPWMNDETLENVKLFWRNFSGLPTRVNKDGGKRTFNIELTTADAERMQAAGWNVKWRDPVEEGDEPTARIEVDAGFRTGSRPPRVFMITSRGKTSLDVDTISILDWASLEKVDLIIHPSWWEVNGRSGWKAYLRALYAHIREDSLELKYADMPDANGAMDSMVKQDDEAPF